MAYISTMAHVTREMCRIAENPKGGALWTSFSEGMVTVLVEQRLITNTKTHLLVEKRVTSIVQPIEWAYSKQPGDLMKGNIYVKEQLSPIDDDDPINFLLWQEDGTVERTEDGKAIWGYSLYSEDEEEQDEIVPRKKLMEC